MTPESYDRVLARIAAGPGTPPENVAVCGVCRFRWDDTLPTDLTPAPGGRCPNEYNHPDETDAPVSLTVATERDARAIVFALARLATESDREARSRKWTGPQFAGKREALRMRRDRYRRLADHIEGQI